MTDIAPKTLEAARLAKGLSLSALAPLCGLSAPTLSRIEAGERSVSEAELSTLAKCLGIPAHALCRPLVSEHLGLSSFYHRKLSRAGARQVRAVESQCVLDIVAIRELIGMIDAPAAGGVVAIDLEDAKTDPEVAAHMVRMAWKMPRGPVENLIEAVEAAGCVVIHSDFGIVEMDALYQKVSGAPPVIWTNSRKPLERVRFSIAHELGHLILHEERPINNALAEDQANTFAAAFLMPRSDIVGEFPARLRIENLVEMKRRWRCSMSAILRRGRDVGRVTAPLYESGMMELSRRGWRKSEPYPLTGESPRALAAMIQAAQRECDCSLDALVHRLGVLPERLIAWTQPFPGQRPNVQQGMPTLRLSHGD